MRNQFFPPSKRSLIFRVLASLLVISQTPLSGQINAFDAERTSATVDTLIERSYSLLYKKQKSEAFKLIDSTLEIVSTKLGKNHLYYAKALGVKGAIFNEFRQYAEGEVLLAEALEFCEKSTDTSNELRAELLYDYARSMRFKTANSAIAHFEESQKILESLGAQQNPVYAKTFLDRSFILINQGKMEQAEEALLTAKAILETYHRQKTDPYLVALVNLGVISYQLNQFDKTIVFFEEALIGFERNEKTTDPRYSVVLTNLGFLYTEKADYEKSKQTYLRSKKVIESSVGKTSPEYAQLALNIGGTHFYLKEFELAEAAFLESKTAYESLGMRDAILYFRACRNIGKVKMEQKKYTEAVAIFEEVSNGWRESVSELDAFYLETKIYLVDAYAKMGDFATSEKHLLQCTDLEKALINRAGAHFSETEMIDYLPGIAWTLDWFGPLLQIQEVKSEKLCQSFYDAQLFRKGYFIQSSVIRNSLAATASDSTKTLLQAWKNTQESLSDLYSQPRSNRSLDADSLELVASEFEKKLIQALPEFAKARQEVRWQDVQAALEPKCAAIEFFDFIHPISKENKERYYGALILLHGETKPIYVSLFKQQDIEGLIKRSDSWYADYTKQLYSHKQPAGLLSLYELIWKPLGKHLSRVEKIYYSVSGILSRINIEAVENDSKSIVADNYQFVALGSTRQLHLKQNNQTVHGKKAVVFGGITYSETRRESTDGSVGTARSSELEKTRSFDFFEADSTLRTADWPYLKTTLDEVRNVEKALTQAGYQTQTRTSEKASEEEIKRIEPPNILHIATHGFFFPDPQQSHATGPVFKTNPNPMMRSGLILAGANYAWKHGKPLNPGMEDGILTAYEISLMDLSHTELVVLSACETGLGDIAGNEGVYGLQRAFKIAGAKYLIMSLWKVPDVQTEELMTLFYQKWLEDQMPIPEAFRAAQGIMRKKYPNPYYWAGFILQE
jgi:CHAT domain-containing protein